MEIVNNGKISIPNKENPFEFLCMKLPECISDIRLNMWVESKFNNVLKNNTMASLNFNDIMVLYASIEAYDICYDHGYLIGNVFDIVCTPDCDGVNNINIALEYHLGCDYINMVFTNQGVVYGTFKIHFGVEIWNVLNNIQYLINQYDIYGSHGDEIIDGITLLFEQGAYVNNIGEFYRGYLKDSGEDIYEY